PYTTLFRSARAGRNRPGALRHRRRRHHTLRDRDGGSHHRQRQPGQQERGVKSVTYDKSAGWLQIRERGNLPLLRLMAWASLRLGRRVGRGLLHLTTVYFVLTSRTMRRASRAYLARALQRRPGWHDLYRHFFCFATTVHDRIFLLNRHHDLFDFDI